MKFYGYKKCSTVKKAKKWLVDNDISFEEIDLVDTPPTKEELKKIYEESGYELKKFFNTSGVKYRELGLKEVKPWGFLGDMGQAVHDHAFSNGYTVVREIGGHGVGLEFHEEPWVGYNSRRGQEMLMVPGMIFTIEPMVNMGQPDIYVDSDNDWEVYTDDGLPSAQWEIMVLVTEDGHEVLCW